MTKSAIIILTNFSFIKCSMEYIVFTPFLPDRYRELLIQVHVSGKTFAFYV